MAGTAARADSTPAAMGHDMGMGHDMSMGHDMAAHDSLMPGMLTPAEMARLVRTIRDTEAALGDGVKRPCANESRNIAGMRRGIVAKRVIAAGARIVVDDLILKRPLSEIPPSAWDKIVGRTARHDIPEGEALMWSDLA